MGGAVTMSMTNQNMERFMWVSAIKPGQEEVFVQQLAAQQEPLQRSLREQGALMCSVFREEGYLFTYLEQTAGAISSIWNEALTPLLQAWPTLDGTAGTYELRMN